MNRINISQNQSQFFVLPTSDFGLPTISTIFNIITQNHDRKGKIN
jgi:hypothetical protein